MLALRFTARACASLPVLCLLATAACSESSPSDGNVSGGAGTSAGTPSSGAAAGAAASGAPATGGSSGAATGGSAGVAGSGTGTGGSASGGGGASSGGGAGAGAGAGGGSAGVGGSSAGAGGGSAGAGGGSAGAGGGATTEPFSFFLTSLAAIRRESNNENGFGGNLGGLTGADEICRKIAEKSLPGSGAKGWRAFLSTTTVNAIDRVGTGPWYDRTGRVFAMNIEGLLSTRPAGDQAIINDLPNEDGVPNRAGTGGGNDDNHDTITGSNSMGKWDGGSTCEDWTSATGSEGPRVGHSWPAQSGMGWIQAHTAPGCEPSVSLTQTGPGSGNGIGNGGGYGGFYCFALKP
jgi:hypothetical protein